MTVPTPSTCGAPEPLKDSDVYLSENGMIIVRLSDM